MILDHLKNHLLYEALSPKIALALRYLTDTDLSALSPGRYPIAGDEVFLLIQEVSLNPESDGKWEAHFRHIDIQTPIRGSERMGYASVETLVTISEQPEKDIRFLEGKGVHFTLIPGEFVVFFPSDAHMPGLDPGGIGRTKKAVVKILLPQVGLRT